MEILVTRSNGTIGTVLVNNLKGVDIAQYDLPENDVLNYQQLVSAMNGNDVVIHLAWNTKDDNFTSVYHDNRNSI